MTIDAHQHFWKYNPVEHCWITDQMAAIQRDFQPEELEELLQGHGMDGCVTVQVSQHETENATMLEQASRNSFVKGIVGWIDLRSSEIATLLEPYTDEPRIKGFRHILQAEPSGFMLDGRFVNGVREIGKRGFTYDLLIYHHQLEEAHGFLSNVAATPIVLDHLAKPPLGKADIALWKTGIRKLATFENLYCKISGMVTEADWSRWHYDDFVPILDVVFEAFGVKRIMYGSDWPVCLLAASYGEQINIVRTYIQRLSETEREAVMGKNAIEFYHL